MIILLPPAVFFLIIFYFPIPTSSFIKYVCRISRRVLNCQIIFKHLLTKLFKQDTIQAYKVVQTNRCIEKTEQFVKGIVYGNSIRIHHGYGTLSRRIDGLI